jgi:hypothetical protein
MITLGERINPLNVLGESIKVFLKAGAAFYFKCTEIKEKHLIGYDQEGMNIVIELSDIDFIVQEENK